jgi:hypothetical protein
MRWRTGILTVILLIAVVLVSGCMLNLGTTKLDFGKSNEAQKALACFCQTYGDPSAYNGPPRFIAPLATTGLKNNIPVDKVTRFSTDTESIFFWVIYQNFEQGEDLHLTWIYQGKGVATITKKTDSKSGIAFGEFIRPDAGWPEGIHTMKMEGKGNTTEVTFYIENSPTERTIFDFTRPEGELCQDLIAYTDRWISVQTPDYVLQCSPSPYNSIPFIGSTGPAVTPGTPVQLVLINEPDSGTQGAQDLPQEGILIGSTNTKNDRSWEYPWNGNVPGYTLRNGQIYKVKIMLPDGTKTTMKFRYVCTGTGEDNGISGRISSSVLTCNSPNNSLQFTGSTGQAVTRGTPVQLKLFNVPDSGIQDIPPEGILIGSATTKNDGGWEYTWDGKVLTIPWYLLRTNQEYMVKALLPDGIYTKMSFRYQCPVPTQYSWVSGGLSSTELSCAPPDNTLLFSGNTYVAPAGTPVQLRLLNAADSGTQDIPPEGILIGSTNVRNGGSYEYRWNGDVPGYRLRDGQEYFTKALFPDSGLSVGGRFRYTCTGTNNDYWISGRSSNSLLTCDSPNNTLQFMGNTGPAVTRGTPVQLKLFNVPGSGIQDIPAEGILIGSANTKNDGGWEYAWNGHVPVDAPVPYMLLRTNQEYMVKALLPDGVYTKVSFLYLCPLPTQYSWVSGGLSNTELSCEPPNNTLLFSGNSYVAPAGTPVQLKLFNTTFGSPIPPEGVLIGSTNVRNGGSYEYRWNGDVPGYRLRNGEEYLAFAMFPDSGMSVFGLFRYVCAGTGNDYWVSGRMLNPVFTCYPPNNHLQFMGTTGPAVPPGTPLQLKIFNVPDSGNNDLPAEGVWIGPASTMNDRSWVFAWDGYVEGYGLIQNQDYMIKVLLPDGTYTKVDLPYQCLGTEAPNWWISDNGRQVLSCSPPNNTVTFMGKTGSDVPPGTSLILKLFHMPDAGTREIFIDYMDVRSDGSYEYTWNGNIRGYTFQNGQEYTVKEVLPGGRYTKQNFLYQCTA